MLSTYLGTYVPIGMYTKSNFKSFDVKEHFRNKILLFLLCLCPNENDTYFFDWTNLLFDC
jgi:hypothetical protein